MVTKLRSYNELDHPGLEYKDSDILMKFTTYDTSKFSIYVRV